MLHLKDNESKLKVVSNRYFKLKKMKLEFRFFYFIIKNKFLRDEGIV